MAQLSTKIKKYLADNGVNTVDFFSDVLLQDDSNGSGPYIKSWNISEVAEPTDSQLNSYDTAADLEDALYSIRFKRDKLIAETDYLALSDQTLSTEMSTYRQALRDITNGITTVEQANNVTWPTKPV
jgi:hypothetical protein